MEWKTRPNQWVAVAAASTTQLTYAPQVNPAPLTVSVPEQTPLTGSLEVVITNPTPNPVQVEAIWFEIQVGQAADALTPTTAGILTDVSDADWTVTALSGEVTDGTAVYVLQSQEGTTARLEAGSSVVVQIFQFATVQQPGTTTVIVKEMTQEPAPGFTQFQITTFPTGFYFGPLIATAQQGSAEVPVAQVAAGQAVMLSWKSSVMDAASYTIYYATAGGQQQATPAKFGEWTSPPLWADTVFTVVVTVSAQGGQPQSASLAVPVGVQNPSLLVAALTAGTATVNGQLTAGSASVGDTVYAAAATVSGPITAQSGTVNGTDCMFRLHSPSAEASMEFENVDGVAWHLGSRSVGPPTFFLWNGTIGFCLIASEDGGIQLPNLPRSSTAPAPGSLQNLLIDPSTGILYIQD